MRLRVLPEADDEALDAALWYEERQPGLGESFLDERERSLERIRESPQTLPRLEGGPGSHDIRRHRLRRFPYAVIYLCLPDEVLVIAMAHLHRRPLYWLDRLGS